MTRMDPDELRAYANRDWGRLDALDRERRARATVADKSAIAWQLYLAAKQTRPEWPTDADRRADLAAHQRLRDLLDRAVDVGTT